MVGVEWRRRGIASALIKAAKSWAMEQGMENLLVACSRSNWPIRSLLEKVGARLDLIFGEIVAQVPINNVMSGEDGIVWLAFSNYAGKGMRMSIPIAAVHGSVVDAVDGSFTGTSVPWMWAPLRLPRFRQAMQTMTTIGLDIAKSVFQVHGVNAGGRVIVRQQLKRRYVRTFFRSCRPVLSVSKPAARRTIGRAEAPGARSYRAVDAAGLCEALRQAGRRTMRLTQRPFCEAVTRVNMRFVPTRPPSSRAVLVLHRARRLFIRQQTSVINAIRAHLAEFGIVAPVGRHGVEELLDVVADPSDKRVRT